MKKKSYLLVAAMLAMPAMFAQIKNVARECVLFELLTGVYCSACPDADQAIEYMMNQGLAIAPVAYQDPYFSEPSLYTSEVSARINYYMNNVCPDLFVDGLTEVEGCYGNTYYMSYYNNRIGVESPFTIAMNLELMDGNRYKVNCQVDQVGECNGSDVRVFIVLTQDHHPYSWYGGNELNYLVRDMIPTNLGTRFTGPSMTFSEEFDINYPLKDCRLVAWVQNYVRPREVYQAVMMETTMVDAVGENEVANAVYPNPSNGQFNLSLGEGQWNVEVFDITGRKVYENIHEGHSTLDLGQSQNGIYFLKAKNEGREITSKLVIK